MTERKPVEMVVVNGVRYRPEDAPAKEEPKVKQAPAPKNKARTAGGDK